MANNTKILMYFENEVWLDINDEIYEYDKDSEVWWYKSIRKYKLLRQINTELFEVEEIK